MKARMFVAEMAEQISMPEVYRDIRRLIGEEDPELDDFADVIARDSTLALRLMRTANSRYFGHPSRANDLRQAIMLIGTMHLHDLVLNSLCLRSFSAIPQQIFNLESFWRYCVECGIAARTIAQYSQTFPYNPYFTFGLLHEIGHAPMFVRKPEESMRAQQQSRDEQRPLIQVEREIFGFDYTQTGAEVMRIWQLPKRYQVISSLHLFPERADENHRLALQIVHLAHQLCQQKTAGMHQESIERTRSSDPELTSLPDNIDQIVFNEIKLHADNVSSMLLPQNTGESSPAEKPTTHG